MNKDVKVNLGTSEFEKKKEIVKYWKQIFI